MKLSGDGKMKHGINLSKGLFFNNELELERAMMILMENGFTPDQNMGTFYDIEIALSVENKRLNHYYGQSTAFSF